MCALETKIIRISKDYFTYMAKTHPVMCLSDEFYFFPRAKEALHYLDELDSLDHQKVKEDIRHVRKLYDELKGLRKKDMDLETLCDLELLKESMAIYLIEFDHMKIWQYDPNLYIKILILGVENLVTKLSILKPNLQEELHSRISQIPRLLNEAKENLGEIPLAYKETAIEMITAAICYFRNYKSWPVRDSRLYSSQLGSLINKAIESLDDFKKFLKGRSGCVGSIGGRELIESLLRDGFSYSRSPEEVFEIARREYDMTLLEMKRVATGISASKTWQGLLSDYRLGVKTPRGLINLYSSEMQKICDFLIEKDIINIPQAPDILVKKTPGYLQAIRTTASYSCPVSLDPRELAYFYVTVYFDGKSAGKRSFDNVHYEYIFVTAHETYPGHHLLDSVRRRLKNPIRQQIESVLFYEGWASYSEWLISQLGYIKDPRQTLIGLKRQAWRAVRVMLDVGLRTNEMKLDDAGRMLKFIGYSPRVVKLMLKHYTLTYGYQLCYTIGKFEIEKLRSVFADKLGLKKFHDVLLEGGQIPFHLIEKRMRLLCRKSS